MSERKPDTHRANELASRAVREMAVSDAPLVDRLCLAWEHHLFLLELPGVPWADLAEDYRDISDYFKLDAKTGRTIVRDVSIDDQRHLAGQIYTFFARVTRRHYSGAEQ